MKFIQDRFRRDVTNFLLFTIGICGVYPYKNQVGKSIRIFWYALNVYGIVNMIGFSLIQAFTKSNNMFTSISLILNIFTFGVCFCTPVVTFGTRNQLKKLFELIDSGFYVYPNENDFQVPIKNSKIELTKLTGNIVKGILSGYTMIILVPIILTYLSEKSEKTEFDLLYVAWIPFDINKYYLINYFTQYPSSVPIVCSFITKTLFTGVFIIELEYQCNKYKYALEHISDWINKKDVLVYNRETNDDIYSNNKYAINSNRAIEKSTTKCHFYGDVIITKYDEKEFLKNLIHSAIHYNQLRKALKYFGVWFNLIYSCEITYGLLCFSLIGYLLIQGTGNVGTDIKYFVLLLLYGGQLFFQCIAGEIITHLELELSDVLYSIPWYNQGPKVKQMVQLLICQANKPHRMYSFHIYPASLPTFTSIMKTSYSYLNLLNKFVDKTKN